MAAVISMCKGLRCWTRRRGRWRWGRVKGEKIPGSGEGLLHSALLISQAQAPPGSHPAPSLLSLSPSLFPGRRPRAADHPRRPKHRQGWPRIPGAKGLITPAQRSEHPGAMETRLGGDESSSKRFPSSQEANNRFMLPPPWTSPRSGVGRREHSGRSAR